MEHSRKITQDGEKFKKMTVNGEGAPKKDDAPKQDDSGWGAQKRMIQDGANLKKTNDDGKHLLGIG